MNVPVLHRSILRHHVSTIEARHPVKIIGVLPPGSASHVGTEDSLDLLGTGEDSLSYLALAQAEIDLSDLIGRPVGIVLVSELSGEEAAHFPAAAQPL